MISGYIRVPSDKVLSFIVIEGTTVTLLMTILGAREIKQKLLDEVPVDTVIQEVGLIQPQVAQFPMEELQYLTWDDYTNSFTFYYTEECRGRYFEAYINSEEDRTELLTLLQSHYSHPFRYESKPVGALKVSWNYLLGVLISVLALIWFLFFWDPADFQNGRRGEWLFLLFGQTGCALVATAFLVGTIYYSWKAITAGSQIHFCLVDLDAEH